MNIKVININAGNNKELLSKSTELNGYSIFIDKIRREIAEVANKMFTEFTYDDMLRIRVNEATEDGMARKAVEDARNFKKAGIDTKIIAECTGLPLEEVEQL